MAITSFQTGTITLTNLTGSDTLSTTVTQANSILLVTARGGSDTVGQYNIRVTLSSDGTTVTATRTTSGSTVTLNYQVIEASEFTVQHFETTLSATGTDDQTITSVDTDYAFPVSTGLSASGGSRSSDDFVSVRITSATNAQLEINSSSTVTVAYQIVEMSSSEIASVQEASTAITAATNDVTVTSVDAAKSLIFASANQLGGNVVNRQIPILSLTSSTNLRFQTALSTASGLTVYAYIVEFVNLAVTSTLTTAISGTTTTEVLGATPTYGGAVINGIDGKFATANDNNDDSLEIMFTASRSGTTWTFERGASTTNADISYSVFDWADIFAGGATYTLVAASGSYAITGNASNLLFNRQLTAESGTYAVTGNASNLLFNRVLVAESGSYALTGYAATLTYNASATYTLTAEAGSYAVTGNNANLLLNRVMVAESGSYAVTGYSASLVYSGASLWTVQPDETSNWANQADATGPWTVQ